MGRVGSVGRAGCVAGIILLLLEYPRDARAANSSEERERDPKLGTLGRDTSNTGRLSSGEPSLVPSSGGEANTPDSD